MFKSSIRRSIALFLVGILVMSCKDENKVLVIPSEYDGSAFETNTVSEQAIMSQFASLSSTFTSARSSSVTLTYDALNELYDNNSTSLADITTTYYHSRISGANGWLNGLASVTGKTYQPNTNSTDGGVFGGYLFDKNGLELQQVIEKGMYASTHYNYVLSLIKGDLTVQQVDAMVLLFGAHPSFPNSNASKHTHPDKYSAVYLARRDKNDGNGFYTTIRDQFIRLQAAVKQGKSYNSDKTEAISLIKSNWEKGIMATVVNYLFSSIDNLTATNPTDAQKASALHSYGEAVGFIHGWRGVTSTDRIITDSQIDELLDLLRAPQNAEASSYLFVTDPVNELPKLQQVIDKIQTIYGFTNSEIQDFKKNWVSEQGR